MKNFTVFISLAGLLFLGPLAAGAQVVNKVVAVVNEEIVTQQDLDQLRAVLYAQYTQLYEGDDLLKKMEEAKEGLLGQVIDDKLILSRAKELNIRVSEQEVEDKLKGIRSGFPSEKVFDETLRMQGVTVRNLKDRYRDQIMMKKLVEFEVKSKVDVLPSEISRYYEKYRSEFKVDERYKVRHILIKAGDEVSFELAKVESGEIHDKLGQGYDFSELAKAHSQDPNKEHGGDMGYISRGTMLQELEDAIFKLKAGEFSGPVRSRLGYHIFKVEDVTDSGYLSLDEVKKDIKKFLFQKELKEKLNEWVGELKSKAYISIK